MADQDPRPRARGDEAEMFEAYSHELISAVSAAVRRTTPQAIEDACAFAWAQFMEHQPDRTGTGRDGGSRTAQREARRLAREIGLPMPIRDVEEKPGDNWVPVDPHDRDRGAFSAGKAAVGAGASTAPYMTIYFFPPYRRWVG
jgi:hypothetical protein